MAARTVAGMDVAFASVSFTLASVALSSGIQEQNSSSVEIESYDL